MISLSIYSVLHYFELKRYNKFQISRAILLAVEFQENVKWFKAVIRGTTGGKIEGLLPEKENNI